MPAGQSPIFITAKDLNKYFTKEAQIAKEKMRSLTSLVIIMKKITEHYPIISIIQLVMKLLTVYRLLCQGMRATEEEDKQDPRFPEAHSVRCSEAEEGGGKIRKEVGAM